MFMKILKKIISLWILIWFISLNTSAVIAEWDAVSVSDLKVENVKVVSVTLNNEIDTNTLTNADLKIMHDIPMENIELDMAEANKATVKLETSLDEKTSYNLISIAGVDGSMDFETASSLDGQTFENTSDEWIQSITILNPMTIEVVYYDAITQNDIEMKLLKDMPIDSIMWESDVVFKVQSWDAFEINSDYIFMLLAAVWKAGSSVEIENGIFDFVTPSELPVMPVEEVQQEPVEEESVELGQGDMSLTEQFMEEIIQPVMNMEQEGETFEDNGQELNAAGEENVDTAAESIVGNGDLDTQEWLTKAWGNIAEVAWEASEVPTTGAASNLLILITLLMSMGIALRKRK